MKKLLFTIVFIVICVNVMSQNDSQTEFLIRYATLSGNKIDYGETGTKVVLPNGEKVSLTGFFQGTKGLEFNYCTKNGLKPELVKTKNKPYRYTVCVDSKGNRISIQQLAFERGDYEYLFGTNSTPPKYNPFYDYNTEPTSVLRLDPPQSQYDFIDYRDIDWKCYKKLESELSYKKVVI